MVRVSYLVRSFRPDGEVDVPAETHCHFHLYGQLAPSPISENEMLLLESEMRTPTGVYTPTRPPVLMDAVLLSKNCGLLYQANHLKGMKYVDCDCACAIGR